MTLDLIQLLYMEFEARRLGNREYSLARYQLCNISRREKSKRKGQKVYDSISTPGKGGPILVNKKPEYCGMGSNYTRVTLLIIIYPVFSSICVPLFKRSAT